MRRLLMVHRQASDEHESEPIVVDTDDPRVVVLELDDGGRLELDRRQLGWTRAHTSERAT